MAAPTIGEDRYRTRMMHSRRGQRPIIARAVAVEGGPSPAPDKPIEASPASKE